MGTGIDWTDHTINPGIYGCTAISEACRNCYAATMARRLATMPHTAERYAGAAKRVYGRDAWTGTVRVDFDAIQPAFAKLPKRKPARVFVTSMSDLFHKDAPHGFIEDVFLEMANRPHLTFQVLTKRPQRMFEWWADMIRGPLIGWNQMDAVLNSGQLAWPRNVWAGCTVEDQRAADERIPWLLKVPARVRFLSMEPLLGPVDLPRIAALRNPMWQWGCGGTVPDPKTGRPVHHHDERCRCPIHWVIAGGESGPHARPTHPDWARGIRDQCRAAGVPFFWKQWGAWVPSERPGWVCYHDDPGGDEFAYGMLDKSRPHSFLDRGEDPKTLDGVAHREFPTTKGGQR